MRDDDELLAFAIEAGRPALTFPQKRFIEHGRFVRPRMGNRLGKAGMSLERRSIDQARDYNRIELNNAQYRNFLAVDVDGQGATGAEQQADAISRLRDCVVKPHVVVPTPHGAHGIWAIDSTPLGTRADEFAKDCQTNLRLSVDGDPSYNAHTVANPLSAALKPIFLRDRTKLYSLNEIHGLIGDGWQRTTFMTEPADAGQGRNAELFRFATELFRKGAAGTDLLDQVMDHNQEAFDVPLLPEEVRSVVKSVQKKRQRSDYRSRLGQRGGSVQSIHQREAFQESRHELNRQRQERAGERLERITDGFDDRASVEELARREGVSRRTIERDVQFLKKAGLLPDQVEVTDRQGPR